MPLNASDKPDRPQIPKYRKVIAKGHYHDMWGEQTNFRIERTVFKDGTKDYEMFLNEVSDRYTAEKRVTRKAEKLRARYRESAKFLTR